MSISPDAGSTEIDDDSDFGFHAAVVDGADSLDSSSAAETMAARGRSQTSSRRGLRRRLTGLAVVAGALLSIGGTYALMAPSSGAADSTASAADIEAGKLLYDTSCITCHGANLQGVTTRGPSLVGAGGASAYFQVSTGRMPLVGQGGMADRKPSKFTDAQVRQIAAFVQSIGGGVNVPVLGTDYRTTTDAQLAEGGDLFRLNCASCHNFAAKGAPLSGGKQAPGMSQSTDAQIYTAMLSGPENMPVFSNNQITPEQKQQIVTFIQTMKTTAQPGGASLGSTGPITEGLLLWTVGLGVLIMAILWIGAKS